MNYRGMGIAGLVMCASAWAQAPEWENEEIIATNKEPTRATGVSFDNAKSAIRAYSMKKPEDALKKWTDSPYWEIQGDGTPIYLNVRCPHLRQPPKIIGDVARGNEVHLTVRANDGSPLLAIRSLGNEAGGRPNLKAAVQAIRDLDTSRPIRYERMNSGAELDIMAAREAHSKFARAERSRR